MTEVNEATPRTRRRSNPSPMVRRIARLLVPVLLAACTASSEEVRPPPDQIFFPTGVAVAPDEGHLFVISANSQLEYDSGTIGVVDLTKVDTAVDGWLADRTSIPADCEQDTTFTDILNCDASKFLDQNAGVRIGNFGANIGVQDKGGGDLRLVVPVRGDPSVTYVDFDGTSLSCGDSAGFPLCDDAHRLTHFLDDDALPQLDPEPYGVFVDSANQFAMVTHLSQGTATLIDLPTDGTPQLSDALSGLFQPDYTGQRIGSVGVAGRTPGMPDDLVYVTSNTENRVQTMSVARPDAGTPFLVPSAFFFLDRVGSNGHSSSDTRAVQFGQGGNVGYFMNRLPPSLTLVDTSLDAGGFPKNQVMGSTDLCRQAVSLQVADVGDGERAYVSCFLDGTMYVIDPRDGVQVVQVAPVGRGPFGIAIAPGRKRLYISNFYENTVAVVDLTPGAETRNRVVLRIGKPTLN